MFDTDKILSIQRQAKIAVAQGDITTSMVRLAPLLRDVAEHVAQFTASPFEMIEWHEVDFAPALKAWRNAIVAWKRSGFTSEHPGSAGCAAVLALYCDDDPRPLNNEYASYGGLRAKAFLRNLVRDVYGRKSGMKGCVFDLVNEQINDIRFEQAMAAGVPHGHHAEFCYIPGWDGESVDTMIEDLALRAKRYRSGYFDELLHSASLAKFLAWVNVSSDDLIQAVAARNPDEAAKFVANLGDWRVAAKPDQPSLISAEDVMHIIENAGSSLPVPMVHVEMDVGDLFRLDPRKPILLPAMDCISPHGRRYHIGMHDPINGSGYLDVFVANRDVEIPPLATGFAWAGRWSYGIDDTYGIVKRPFYCSPVNVDEACPEDLAPTA